MKVAIVVVIAFLAGAHARNINVNWLPNGMPQLELVKPVVVVPETKPLPAGPSTSLPQIEIEWLPNGMPQLVLPGKPQVLPAPEMVVPETKPLPAGPSTSLPQIEIEWLPNGMPQLVLPGKPQVLPIPEVVVPETKPLPAPSTKPQIEITWLPNGMPQLNLVKPSTEGIVRPEVPSVQPPQVQLPEIVVPEIKPVPVPSTKPQIEITWLPNGMPQLHLVKPSTEGIARPEVPSIQPPQIQLPEIVVPEIKPLPVPSTKPQIEITWLPNGMPQLHLVKPSTEGIVRPERPSVQPPQIQLPEIVVPEIKPLPVPSTKPQIEITWLPNGMPQLHLVKPSTEGIVRPERPSVQPPQIQLPEILVPEIECGAVVVPETRPEIIIPEIGVFPAPGGVRPEVRPIEVVPQGTIEVIQRPQVVVPQVIRPGIPSRFPLIR